MDLIRMVVVLGSAIIWIPLSLYILIKTMPWVMGAFALLLRPFDKFLGKLLTEASKPEKATSVVKRVK